MAYRQQDLYAEMILFPDRVRAKILKAIESGDNAQDAADKLDISKALLYIYINKLGMEKPGYPVRRASPTVTRRVKGR